MYQTILLCFDGTRESRKALREGSEIAEKFQAAAHLLAVVRLPVGLAATEGVVPQELFQVEQQRAREILDEGVNRLKSRGLLATGHIALGEPVEQIISKATELRANLIVLGHRHQGTLGRWWRGSVGTSLLDQAPCSVLIGMPPGE